MKVLIVNTYDKGGAAKSCKRLHLGLLSLNIDSKVLLRHQKENWPASFTFKNTSVKNDLRDRIGRIIPGIGGRPKINLKSEKFSFSKEEFLHQRQDGLEMFSFPDSDTDITRSRLYKEADIINLHWVADFLDYRSFFRKNTKPVVWTLHDMSPFRGAEHYEEEFLGVNASGFPIKRSRTEKEIKISEEIIDLKFRLLKNINNLNVVAPSRWLVKEAENSRVFKGKRIYNIPYGVDSQTFAPRDKGITRKSFNLPANKKVVLFVADSINNNRKGFIYLKKALENLNLDDVTLCAVGKESDELKAIKGVIHLGVIDDEIIMSSIYSAADVFVIPSLMDNLPNTVLESLMCGTPVIGFPVGGIPEMVQDGENGLICEEISVASLAEKIREFLSDPKKFNRNRIREKAVGCFDLAKQAEEYLKLFKQIESNKTKR